MMEFPGRIYLRAEDDINSPDHQIVVNNWISEFERNRRTFVFPEKPVRSIGYIFIVTGLLSMIVQITLSSVQHAYIPSLLGSGIWIGLLCIATGIAGIYAAQKKDSSNLLDFMVMTTIINMFSAMVVILNTIGLEMYSKLCSSGRAREWIGDCGDATITLQSILVVLNVFLFIFSACCGGFICRALDSSFQIRMPPLVIYYSQRPIEKILETEEQQASKLETNMKDEKINQQRGDVASE